MPARVDPVDALAEAMRAEACHIQGQLAVEYNPFKKRKLEGRLQATRKWLVAVRKLRK
jgi:hypothetical protein